jgi:DNA-binding MarR family transcriptional regulator
MGHMGHEPDAAGAPADDLDRIEQALGALGRLALQRPLHEQTMAQAGARLERAGVQVLTRLGECGPIRLSELAGRLALTVSTASRHVAQLEQAGLVRRVGDPTDRRSAVLHITEAGRELLGRIRRVRRRRLERMLAGWSPRERHQLAVLLGRFADELWAAARADLPGGPGDEHGQEPEDEPEDEPEVGGRQAAR